MKFSFDADKAILVVADMQKLFTDPSSPYGNDASPLIEPTNNLTKSARAAGIPVIHTSYQLKKDGSDQGLRSDWPQIGEGYFDPKSPWAAWDHRLEQEPADHILNRNRPGIFHNGQLEALLKKLGREQVILSGLSINYAISFSVHEAFSRDIPVFLVEDLSTLTAFEDQSKRDYLHQTLDMWACQLISLEDMLDKLDVSKTADALS